MVAPRVVFFSSFDDQVNALVASYAPAGWKMFVHRADVPDPEKAELLRDADFLVMEGGRLSGEAINKAEQLRVVQLLSAGYDRVDLAACHQQGITVCNNGGANSWAVAEHTIALLLALYRRLLDSDRAVRAGEWPREVLHHHTFEVAGKTAGIVGLGRIGSKVARRLHAFEASPILYCDVVPRPELEGALGLQRVPLEGLLRRADIVTLHTPLTAATHHMIGRPQLNLMKPAAVLINTSRGAVVDEAALAEALRQGRIAGAGLDVFEQEPARPDNPLLKLPNTVLTPHGAGTTYDSWSRRAQFAFANLQRAWAGKEPESVVQTT